jgi:adenylate cyclase
VRLVKMIGDAAMFMSPDVPALVATISALVESVEAEGPEFPSIRVGITYGPATTRGGDWFGATVNTASRITDLAKPGAIVATEAVVDAGPGYAWHRRRRRGLKGVEGRVRLFVLDGPRVSTLAPSG